MTESQSRGRLAQMIATRGGLAPPEAPFVIEHREALIYMLCEASELEHGIMCQYLYAAFSLKQSEDEGLTQEETEAVNRWRKHISHIAVQEMLHLSLVQNLLSAIGAAPHLSRPNFPHPASHYPAGVHLALLPFGEAALRHFMFLERPEGMDISDADGMAAFRRATPSVQHGEIVPRAQDFATVGHLYRSIEQGFTDLAAKLGEDQLFAGPPQAQATAADFGWPELIAVTDVASAQRAIDEILEQGEGPRGHWKDAHFGQFVEILDEYMDLREANPAFDPVRPVVPVNVRPAERDVDVPLVTDPVTKRVMDLFNVSYEILLLMMQRFFASTEETPAQLKSLSDGTVTLMLGALKPLGDLVTTLPAGPEYPGRTAGPSFELFYESDYVLPHREAAWILLTERLRQAADFCEPGGPCDPAVTDRLVTIRSTLSGIADTLAVHLPARYAPEPEPAEDRATLLARAQDLYRTSQAHAPADNSAPPELAALLADAYRAVQAPQTAPRVAARLVDSVLRPLAGQAAQPQVPLTSTDSHPSLWDLAVTATTLRVRIGTSAPPGLLEATAALQDLAIQAHPARRPPRPHRGARPAPARAPARHRDRQERPLPGHQRHHRAHPARRRPAGPAHARAVPLRRLGPQAVLRRRPRDQRVHRRQGPQPGARPARHLPRRAGHDLRQPGHLPALRPVHRPGPDRVPHRHRAVRRPQRRPPRRAGPGRPRLPVRRAEPGLRPAPKTVTWPTGTAPGSARSRSPRTVPTG